MYYPLPGQLSGLERSETNIVPNGSPLSSQALTVRPWLAERGRPIRELEMLWPDFQGTPGQ